MFLFPCSARMSVTTALVAMTLTLPPSTMTTTMTTMPHPAVSLTPYQTACRPVWNELASPCYHQTIIQSSALCGTTTTATTTSFFDEDDMLPEDARVVVEGKLKITRRRGGAASSFSCHLTNNVSPLLFALSCCSCCCSNSHPLPTGLGPRHDHDPVRVGRDDGDDNHFFDRPDRLEIQRV